MIWMQPFVQEHGQGPEVPAADGLRHKQAQDYHLCSQEACCCDRCSSLSKQDTFSEAFVSAAWLREQADYLARPHFTRDNVVKITGSNSSQEKARVMALFNEAQR